MTVIHSIFCRFMYIWKSKSAQFNYFRALNDIFTQMSLAKFHSQIYEKSGKIYSIQYQFDLLNFDQILSMALSLWKCFAAFQPLLLHNLSTIKDLII